jgi:phage terminase Nu1 subunit (DNA packaging protein)
MPKISHRTIESEKLKGWQQIASFLGQPVSVVQRWATEGMPVKKQGRYVESSPEELNRWLGRESAGEPVHIASQQTDLSAELKRGLSYVRKQGRAPKKKAA